ncbi:MAG: S-methyl-5'-thioadenosine phosphorylase [Candidatus Riflebacteria bacterium]|nr:S-methyl-5'-thioadenosine phosphorylase [Candidatus Riflebacteria bacterium]
MNVKMPRADIGVFGGSGFYSMASKAEEYSIHTPYGSPSERISIGRIGNYDVAFLPRHGRDHSIPPHKINYRANLWAMKELGVSRIISPCACGSLQQNIKPGDFVITDQFVDRTSARSDTFFEGPKVVHISAAEPYCPELRKLAIRVAKDAGITTHETGTMVVIQGPRFSSKAESKWFTKMGWETINMTQYPEVVLAQELGMCIVNIALVTDYDAGLVGNVPEVTTQEVMETFKKNGENLKKIIEPLILRIPAMREMCKCADKPAEGSFS